MLEDCCVTPLELYTYAYSCNVRASVGKNTYIPPLFLLNRNGKKMVPCRIFRESMLGLGTSPFLWDISGAGAPKHFFYICLSPTTKAIPWYVFAELDTDRLWHTLSRCPVKVSPRLQHFVGTFQLHSRMTSALSDFEPEPISFVVCCTLQAQELPTW